MKTIQKEYKDLKIKLADIETQLVNELKESEEVQERLGQLKKGLNAEKMFFGVNQFGDAGQCIKCVAFPKQENEDDLRLLEEALKELASEELCAYMEDGNHNELYFHVADMEAIIINEDGDIFSGNRCIISKGEYENTNERNQLIENYMEKSGCFPGVFRSDRYGYLRAIDTQKSEE
jgi:hypothetical protein